MSIKGARPNERRIAPHLLVDDGAGAVAFYVRAFGAEELYRSAMPGGQGIHAQIQIADSVVLITETAGDPNSAPPNVATKTVLELYVDHADAMVQRAIDAGATVVYPLMDTFFGDRYGQIRDPFGHVWGLATVKEELTPAEVDARMQAYAPRAHGS